MAIINNNVQNVKFLRNAALYESREAARAALEANKGLGADGTALLARYSGETATDVKTLAGLVWSDGTNYTVTIIDVEGGSSDVEKLREEIDAKLGEGVSSANTVTDQLEALSGTNADTSATTSVEGAKRYAEDLISTLDGGVTAETGSYVVSVSEVDGKISGTTAELPTVAGEVESKKVVMSVSEDKGEIVVEKGDIVSTDKTVKISDVTDASDNVIGIDLEVNIDGVTLEKDANGVISVTSSALTQYVGDDNTIQISAAVAGVKTVSSPLTIQKVTTGLSANVKEEYHLVGNSGNTIGAPIQIYKDSALLSVALLHADYSDPSNPVLPTYDKTNGWTDIDATAQTAANQALCYAYEDAEGEVIVAAVPVGSFINEAEFASGITWDSAEGKVRGVVDPTSESFLTVGADGFKISGVSGLVDNVIESLDATVTGATSGNHVTITIEELDGKLVQSGLTITESNIANADDLAELSGKTVTAITSTNGSITASIDDAAGCKTYNVETDASKIKMSGLTDVSDTKFSGLTTDSSITDAVNGIVEEIIANEDVISDELEELREDIDTVSGDVETIKDNYVSGITVNGSGVTVTNNVAPLAIASAPASNTESSPITVTTAEGGVVTLTFDSIDCGTY